MNSYTDLVELHRFIYIDDTCVSNAIANGDKFLLEYFIKQGFNLAKDQCSLVKEAIKISMGLMVFTYLEFTSVSNAQYYELIDLSMRYNKIDCFKYLTRNALFSLDYKKVAKILEVHKERSDNTKTINEKSRGIYSNNSYIIDGRIERSERTHFYKNGKLVEKYTIDDELIAPLMLEIMLQDTNDTQVQAANPVTPFPKKIVQGNLTMELLTKLTERGIYPDREDDSFLLEAIGKGDHELFGVLLQYYDTAHSYKLFSECYKKIDFVNYLVRAKYEFELAISININKMRYSVGADATELLEIYKNISPILFVQLTDNGMNTIKWSTENCPPETARLKLQEALMHYYSGQLYKDTEEDYFGRTRRIVCNTPHVTNEDYQDFINLCIEYEIFSDPFKMIDNKQSSSHTTQYLDTVGINARHPMGVYHTPKGFNSCICMTDSCNIFLDKIVRRFIEVCARHYHLKGLEYIIPLYTQEIPTSLLSTLEACKIDKELLDRLMPVKTKRAKK